MSERSAETPRSAQPAGLRLASAAERLRSSLFFLPMAAVIVALVGGLVGVWLDTRYGEASDSIPLVLSSTVDSARAILSTVAAATISFAGIAFSVSLLVIQGTSSQYSPRVVHTLFRDPFNRRVVALVVGTFAYCVMVLRSVRGPLDDGGQAVVPNLSVSVALILGVAAILATVAFINHSAHSMDVSEILERVTRESIDQVRLTWTEHDDSVPALTSEVVVTTPSGAVDHVVRFDGNGWVQQVDRFALCELVPEGGAIEVHISAGRYAIAGTPLCSVNGVLAEPEEFDRCALSAVILGDSRTMQQDAGYGLRQLVDVALRALSPGVNDPTTAQDAIFHTAAVLTELLQREPPPAELTTETGGRLVFSEDLAHDGAIRLAYDEVRRAAAGHPTVCIYLLESLELVRRAVEAAGLRDRSPSLESQARLIVEGCNTANVLEADRMLVRSAYEDRFG